VAIAVVIGTLIVLRACCCVRRAPVTAAPVVVASIPPIGNVTIPMPTEGAAKAPTEAQMANVRFRLDPILSLDIHSLRGQMVAKRPGMPVNFDNKNEFVMRIDHGVIGMTSASLDRLMNGYVFGYPNAPLRALHITMDGRQLRQEGIIHKIVDIPFTMWADVSASGGLIRIHPTKIEIHRINGLGLLRAVGVTLEKMLKMPVERGVRAEKNDLLLDPNRVLPPPRVELHLVEVHIAGDELVQTYDSGRHVAPLQPPAAEKNYMYFRSGTLRMGKLLMVDADMEVVDTDPRDPLDFYLDRYNDQLSAGFDRNQPNYGLVVFMRDFADLGKPPQPGERLAPK
jgi:hypothetical protein